MDWQCLLYVTLCVLRFGGDDKTRSETEHIASTPSSGTARRTAKQEK